MAAAIHNWPKLAIASHSSSQCFVDHPQRASPSPPSSRSNLSTTSMPSLTSTKLPLFISLHTCHLYSFIHDLSIYACVVPLCQSISYVMVSISCAMEMCYSFGRRLCVGSLCVCVVCLWTEPLSRLRDRTSFEHFSRGFVTS